MLIVAAWTAIILAIFTSLVALLRAALELDEEHAEKAEALGFARLLLTLKRFCGWSFSLLRN